MLRFYTLKYVQQTISYTVILAKILLCFCLFVLCFVFYIVSFVSIYSYLFRLD
jgi:hypothetical protein